MQYSKLPSPWSTNEERLVSEALAVADIPGAWLQQNIRPPLPQIQLLPPRFGYGTSQERCPTISMVLAVDRVYTDRKDALSGGPQEINSSARYDMNGSW